MIKNIPELYLGTSPTIYSSFFNHDRLILWNTLIQNPPDQYAKNYLSRFYERYSSFFKEGFYFVPLLMILNKFFIFFTICLATINFFNIFSTQNIEERKIIIALASYVLILTVVGILSAEGRFRMSIMPAMNFLAMMFLFKKKLYKNL